MSDSQAKKPGSLSPSDYQALVDRAPGIVYQFRLRPNGEVEFPFITGQLHDLTRLNPVEVMSDPETLLGLMSDEDRQTLNEMMARSAAELSDYDFEHRALLPNGTVRWFKVNARPRREEDGSVLWDGMILDITRLKRAEEEFRNSEARYRALVETIPDAVFIRRPEGIIYANRAATELLAASGADKLIGLSCLELISPEDRPLARAQLAQVEAGEGDGKPLEISLMALDGTIRQVQTRTTQVPLDDGPATLFVAQDISDRKQAEARLRFVGSIAEQVSDAIIVTDSDQRISYVNRAFEEIYGYRADEIVGQYPGCLNAEPDAERIQADIRATVGRGEIWQGRHRNRRRDGTTFFCDMRIAPIFESADPNVTYIGLSRDVTLQVEAEQALKDSETLFRELFNNMSNGVAIYKAVDDGLDFVFKDLNRAGLEYGGKKSKDEVVGRRVTEVFPGIIGLGLLDVFRRVWKTGRPEHHPSSIYRDNYLYTWVENYVCQLPTGEIVAVYDDTTARKRAEQKLQEANERLMAILDGINIHIYVADLETHEILFMNQDMQDSYGRDLTGQTCYLALANESSPCAHCRNHLLTDHRNNPTAPVSWEGYSPNTGKWCLNIDRAIRWVGGRMAKIQVATDITSIKEMERQRSELEKRLVQAQKMEAVGTLAGGIAHDFNNILAAIIGYTELALDEAPDARTTKRYLDNILKSSLRARDLVKQILSFSRQADVEHKPILLDSIVKETVKLLRAAVPTTIDIELGITPELKPVEADPTQIHQLVLNLGGNAADAMKETGGRMEIELANVSLDEPLADRRVELQPGDYVRLSVSDSGPGIPPEILDRIFDPFFTTKEVGSGTGMGLSVVHGIVQSHGGAVLVDSRSGRGTVVRVYLPVTIGEGDSAKAEAGRRLPRGEERILWVDDEPSLAEVGGRMLKKLGYAPTIKTSSREALETFRANPAAYDLVITDMAMPHMTGVSLAKEMLKIRPDVPIILCTGYSDQIDETKALALGIRRLAFKPLSLADTARIVRKVLDE